MNEQHPDRQNPQPTDPQAVAIRAGIERARRLVDSGDAAGMLRKWEFVDDERAGMLADAAASKEFIDLDEERTIQPADIVGAENFESMEGRGFRGVGEVSHRQLNRKRESREAIQEYATLDTPLPRLDPYALRVFRFDRGRFAVYSGNSHRTAAAVLRNEPLKFKDFTLYDLADVELTAEQAAIRDEMLAAKEANERLLREEGN